MNFLRNMPRKVLISTALLVFGLVLLGVLFPLLTGADEDADTMAARLNNEITQTRSQISQAITDQKYIAEHQAEYEDLLKGDRLVPHTRRAAVAELQKVASRNGISLSYVFQAPSANSLTAAQSQPTTAAYRVSVESISLKISAATDGAIYRFLEDIADSFPGSAITQSVRLSRVPDLTAGIMANLASGKDAGIVTGDIEVLWRTAEAQEQPGGGGK